MFWLVVWLTGFAVHLGLLALLRHVKIQEDGDVDRPESRIVLGLIVICGLWPIGWFIVLVALFFIDRFVDLKP